MSPIADKLKESAGRVRWKWDSMGEDGQKKAKLILAGSIAGVAMVILVVTQVLPGLFGSSGEIRVTDPTAFADLEYLSSRTRADLEAELSNRRQRLDRLIAEQGDSGEYTAAARRAVERVEQAISRHGGSTTSPGR